MGFFRFRRQQRGHLHSAKLLHCAALTIFCFIANVASATEAEPAADNPAPARPFAFAKELPSPGSDAEFLPDCDPLCFAHFYSTFMVGRGLRFNNPFRLRTQLGDGADSLSLTAPYGDVALGAVFGDPSGFQQGAMLSLSVAFTGVPQQVLAPGYAAIYRLSERWQLRAHGALPIVLQPDVNLGLDIAGGAAFMVFSGIGVVSSAVFSLYQGAGTDQKAATLVPLLSVQLGISVDYEVLP
jgi:hypothetical protein